MSAAIAVDGFGNDLPDHGFADCEPTGEPPKPVGFQMKQLKDGFENTMGQHGFKVYTGLLVGASLALLVSGHSNDNAGREAAGLTATFKNTTQAGLASGKLGFAQNISTETLDASFCTLGLAGLGANFAGAVADSVSRQTVSPELIATGLALASASIRAAPLFKTMLQKGVAAAGRGAYSMKEFVQEKLSGEVKQNNAEFAGQEVETMSKPVGGMAQISEQRESFGDVAMKAGIKAAPYMMMGACIARIGAGIMEGDPGQVVTGVCALFASAALAAYNQFKPPAPEAGLDNEANITVDNDSAAPSSPKNTSPAPS